LGITQEELAWRADLHRTYIADIERGGRNVTLRSVAQLAEALQVSVASLLTAAAAPAGAAERGRGNVLSEPGIGEVLLVEDDPADVELTLRAFGRAKFVNPVNVVHDGAEALEFLFGGADERKGGPRRLPQLVLLDLQLPKVDGLEVLRRIKASARTKQIPVVVLTSSHRDENIIACARLGAENYIIKPVSFDNFCKVAARLMLRWALLDTAAGAPAAPD
jgi:CheY-like chemotaxis protein/DNA-binding XRE family transcriptional regulator